LFHSHLTQFNSTSAITVRGPDKELSDYIDKIKREEVTENIFQFWSDHCKTYESLSPLALDFLAAPASQAYTERLFSVCGDLMIGNKNPLTVGLERTVMLKMNSKYYD